MINPTVTSADLTIVSPVFHAVALIGPILHRNVVPGKRLWAGPKHLCVPHTQSCLSRGFALPAILILRITSISADECPLPDGSSRLFC
jgi:hypothetical protein